MANVFWDSQGVVYTDYLEKGKTITGLYYAELLGRIAEKSTPFGKKSTLHDNAPIYISAVATAKSV